MKIVMRTLTFVLTIFLHFCDLNATLRERSPNLSPPRLVHNPPAGSDSLPHREVRYGHLLIKLWLDRQDPTRVVKVDYLDTESSDPVSITLNHFIVKLIDVGGFKIVGYLEHDETIFAVRAPNPNAGPNDLEPSPTKWFIVQLGRACMVKISAATKMFVGLNENVHGNPEDQREIRMGRNVMGGISCIIRHRPDGIFEAQMNPNPPHHL
ncbi:uncharacterized protein LOC117173008 isoform X2 [Belonocnema kinseyi]|uniref:uncharacterized protein LOC117173008 isoform X2 n=1 Tax=Belonocnema kinseyi TaxID=2817044 RepID=UPI00143D0F18|nr:uncharacterized protein LOC117173008 isoform X2 [Belonocnema kinseyi]XP_033217242.1 uncharacterized protein LOC117173008 isoform X2 [Belonocnema kinseyi]XP_033217243.1 uncharacterized protein LOC117173008 isoform X2 [Belonocnema kinseyi]XP_033217244.1 uncharacterized protein LOC117173008 isoform X2 [Belonocnema kinseyi]XP_033217245.1 uncharacterized protein LOC117173008 isoform X2 [Belonocnema kinseyi]XP_033217246.1 uncharacterized protein LOC117173008 isoform X2 [Belonocnema kinseyi]